MTEWAIDAERAATVIGDYFAAGLRALDLGHWIMTGVTSERQEGA